MRERIPQSTIIRVTFDAYLSSDHVSPATGKNIAVTISKNGGAFANPSAGATNAIEISAGSYYVDLSTTDTGTLGPLIFKATEAAIDPVKIHFDVAEDATRFANALLDLTDAIETGLTLRNAQRLQAAAAAGKLSGAATSTVVIRNAVADSKNRISATVDADGNRSAVTVDLT